MEKLILDYIKLQPSQHQELLTELHHLIIGQNNSLVCAIKYAMPTYVLNNVNCVHFALAKNHLGFYPTPSPIIAFNEKLKQYKTSKGAIQLPINIPLPKTLITEIVQFRIKEILG